MTFRQIELIMIKFRNFIEKQFDGNQLEQVLQALSKKMNIDLLIMKNSKTNKFRNIIEFLCK